MDLVVQHYFQIMYSNVSLSRWYHFYFETHTDFPHTDLAILGAVICVAAIVGIIGAYIRRSAVTYIYMIIIIGALVFQVIIGIRVYQKAANAAKYLSDIWPTASASYRLNLQNQVGIQSTR